MSTSAESKKAILESLQSFQAGPLLQNAAAFFNTLGYRSDKTIDLSPNTPERFLNAFDPKDVFQKDKALVAQWQSIDIVFQITDEEINVLSHDQLGLRFDSSTRVDDKLIHSYLFIALELKAGHYTRTDLAVITRQINRLFPMPVLVLFKIEENLTLSIIDRRLHKKDAARDVLQKVTLIKDIRYKTPHRAHIEILYDLSFAVLYDRHRFSNFAGLHQAWQKTLDTDELNKRFYKELANWYFWAIHEVKFPSQNNISKNIREPISVIRLITRIIFVWFIKEKGLIPETIFIKEKLTELLEDFSPESSSYYKAVLQNLFFATLNTKMGERKFRDERRFQGKNTSYMIHNRFRYQSYFRKPEEILRILKETPFLNGGLFECLDRETEPVVRIDGFSDRKDNELDVPNFLFFSDVTIVDLNEDFGTKNKKYKVRGLIDLLQSYKFTITENTPIEEEIALDPELLGKVFENLLASHNPETETTARKQTGSFYTPREIVNYMVDEALIAYFENALVEDYQKQKAMTAQSPASQEKMFGKQDAVQTTLRPESRKIPVKKLSEIQSNLRHMFEYTEDDPLFGDREKSLLVKAIDHIKILDPACGSGAFPMGILHRLVFLLGKLDPKNKKWEDKQIAKAEEIEVSDVREEAIRNIEDAFDKNKLDYPRKLYLIQNCIFGVDIQSIAVQIAKLRFFISLIVDQNTDYQEENLGLRPLPNLETKIVAANALIGFKGEKQPLRSSKIIDLESDLRQVRKEYFSATSRPKKRACEEKDKKIREEISRLLKEQNLFQDLAVNIDRWDPYNQNESAEFFDPEWMFGITQGFDVIIGNPPYIRQEKIKSLKPVLKNQYKCFTGTADIYVYFFELAVSLLNTGGILSFISSNKYFRSGYGQKLRSFLGTQTAILQLIDFGDAPVFTSIAYPSIIILKKLKFGFSAEPGKRRARNDEDSINEIKALNWEPGPPIEQFPQLITQKSFQVSQNELSGEGWRIESLKIIHLIKKLKNSGQKLGNFITGKIYYGIKTGLNEAFVVNSFAKDRLIKEDPSCEELFKPFLRGKDVKRWRVDFKGEYLIKIESSANKEHPWSDLSEEEAEKTFSKTYPSIYKHFLGFKERLTKRDDKGKYYWELRSCKYWNDFENPKIVYPDIAKDAEFAYDLNGHCLVNTLYLMPANEKWLLGLLNSKTVLWLYSKISAKIRGNFFRFFTQYVSQIPVPQHRNLQRVSRIVEKILENSNTLSKLQLLDLESQIDAWIAHAYKLHEEEYSTILQELNTPEPFRVSAMNLYYDIAKGKIK